MRKSWLLCVLLATLTWGQAQPGTTPAQASPAQAPGAAKAPTPPAEVPENAVVLTIKGVCAASAEDNCGVQNRRRQDDRSHCKETG